MERVYFCLFQGFNDVRYDLQRQPEDFRSLCDRIFRSLNLAVTFDLAATPRGRDFMIVTITTHANTTDGVEFREMALLTCRAQVARCEAAKPSHPFGSNKRSQDSVNRLMRSAGRFYVLRLRNCTVRGDLLQICEIFHYHGEDDKMYPGGEKSTY